MKLEELLRTIRPRPKMYLYGDNLFSALVNLIWGYSDASDTDAFPDRQFQKWLLEAKRFPSAPNIIWAGIIWENYSTDQERFEAFFTLYDEFSKKDLSNPASLSPT